MQRLRIIASTLTVLVTLAALVGTTSAARLSVSSQTLRSTFARWDFGGGFGTLECPLTLEGSLHARTIAKTTGSLIGYITRAIAGACIRGSATMLAATLPWHIRYTSFSGTLPNITRLGTSVTGINFNIREPTFGIACLAANATSNLFYTREAGGVLASVEIEGTNIETSCGIRATLAGRSTALTVLGAATRITVTLI